MADPSVGDLNDSAENDEGKMHIYQDDIVTDDTVIDPISVEEQGENDDPVKMLQVPETAYAEEMEKRAFEGTGMPARTAGANGNDSDGQALYEGTEDDLYNEQEDAADQASDELDSQDEAAEAA